VNDKELIVNEVAVSWYIISKRMYTTAATTAFRLLRFNIHPPHQFPAGASSAHSPTGFSHPCTSGFSLVSTTPAVFGLSFVSTAPGNAGKSSGVGALCTSFLPS